jgi:hypothetical protein
MAVSNRVHFMGDRFQLFVLIRDPDPVLLDA